MMKDLLPSGGRLDILSATENAPGQTAWIKDMKDHAGKGDFSTLSIGETQFGNDDAAKSSQIMTAMLAKGDQNILAPTAAGLPAAAKVLSGSGKKGQVVLSGLALPSAMKAYLADGTVKEFGLWNVPAEGWATAYLIKAIIDGTVKSTNGSYGGQKFTYTPPAGAASTSPVTLSLDDTATANAEPVRRVQLRQHRPVQLLMCATGGRRADARRSATEEDAVSTFRVRSLPVGRSDIPGPELYWMKDFDRWYPLVFQVVLIQSGSVTALVNTGPAADLGPMNEGWAAFLGERAAMRRDDGEFVLDQLARVGVAPQDVTHVLLTPLQLYTISNVLAFPNAQICLSERGWLHFHRTHEHPHDARATSIPDDILTALVTSRWNDVRLLADEDTIVPGLRTWWSGGHHRASLVVEADTAVGVVAISDTYFCLDNVLSDHPIGIAENIYEVLACHERVRRDADVIVSLYDPSTFVRFPDGVIA